MQCGPSILNGVWRRLRIEPILDSFCLLAKARRLAEVVESTDASTLTSTEQELLEVRRELSELAEAHAEAGLYRWSHYL